MGNMGSAHPLVKVNVSFKFEGNPSIGIGFIERTCEMSNIYLSNTLPLTVTLTLS